MLRSRFLVCVVAALSAVSAHAGFVQDDNRGSFRVDFLGNGLGLEPEGLPFQENVRQDPRTGTMTLEGTAGRLTTIGVVPTSFQAWRQVLITASANARNDLRVSLLECGSAAVVPGFFQVVPVAGRVDLSSLTADDFDCLQVQVVLADADGVVPIVDDVEVTWTPTPVIQVTMGGLQNILAGSNASYQVGVADSFVDAAGVVVYVPLPDDTRGITNNAQCARQLPPAGSFPCAQDQDFTPTFLSASNGGARTASSTIIDGVAVPANAVFWRLGAVKAGRTQSLSFVLNYKNGLQNQVQYVMAANVGTSGPSEIVSTGSATTVLRSNSAPALEATLHGTVFVNGQDFVFDEASYSPVVTYNINTRNIGGQGRETIFNPIVEALLEPAATFLVSTCGVSLADVPSLIDVPGGTFDAATGIARLPLIANVGPDAAEAVHFSVDYSACLDAGIADTQLQVEVRLVADNAFAQAFPTVAFGFDPSASGLISMGERLRGALSERGGIDDLADQVVSFGETNSTTMLMVNNGALRLDDLVLSQQIPAGFEFVGVDVPGGSGAVVFYATTTAFPNPDVHPDLDGRQGPTDLDVAGSQLWRPLVADPPASPAQVTWVAAWVPCLQSTLFPSPAGAQCAAGPTSVRAEVQVRAKRPDETGFAGTDACDSFDRLVPGHFEAYGVSTSIANDDAAIDASQTMVLRDVETLHVAPPLGRFNNTITSVTGAGQVQTNTNASWTLTVRNDGADTALASVVEIAVPRPAIAGVATPLAVTAVGGGVVDWSSLPNRVRISLGDVPVGVTRTVQLSLFVPEGLFDGEALVIAPTIAGADNDQCAPIVAQTSFTTFVAAPPRLQIRHEVTEALVASGGDLHYSLTVASEGQGPSQRSWAVERIPTRTTIVEAYTDTTDDVGNVFDCNGCQVFFAAQTASLPSDVTPGFTFAQLSQFQLGTETAPGVWMPPAAIASSAVWVAWRVDDVSLTPAQVPVGARRTVGLRVRDKGSASGSVLVEASGTLSADLPIAVSNAVITAVLADPGLNVDVQATPAVVSATDTYAWQTTYFNDAANPDTEVTLTQTFPVGTIPITVTHTWNDYTLGNDPTLPAGSVTLGVDIATVTPNLDGSTTVTIVVCSNDPVLGEGIRGDDLALAEGGVVTWTVQASPGLQSGTALTTTVEGCYENANNSFCLVDDNTVDVANAELSLTKLVDNLAPLPGDEIHYTLVVKNTGRVPARNVVVADALPSGICFVPGSTRVTTPAWSMPEPRHAGAATCATAPSTLTLTGLFNPAFPPAGTLPARSADVIISYSAIVDGTVRNGTTLTNGASVTTSTAEDGLLANDSAADIRTPLPDPFVTLTGDAVVLPGGAGSWTIGYGNSTRPVTTDVAIVLDVPDFDADGAVDVVVTGANGYGGEQLFCHRGPAGARPQLNAVNPISNGWLPLTSCLTADAPASFVGAVIPALGGLQIGSLWVGYSAKDPSPQPVRDLAAGVVLTSTCVVTGPDDDNTGNNSATFTAKTPGFDLVATIVGSVEGVRPGTLPFAEVTYTVAVSNQGAENVCDVFADLTTTNGLSLAVPASLGSLRLIDSTGNIVLPRDPVDADVRSPVPLTVTTLAAGFRVGLGGAAVCVPPGASMEGTFTAVVGDVVNDTTVTASCLAGENAAGAEDIVDNNLASSSVRVLRADVEVAKVGVSCGKDPNCATADPDFVDVGDTVDYTFSYANVGGAAADGVVINDILPRGTCYRVNSLEKRLPPRATASYSDDGVDFGYQPVLDANGVDCGVVAVQVVFEGALAPGLQLVEFATSADWNEGAFAGGTTGQFDVLSNASGAIDLTLDNNLAGPGVQSNSPALAVDDIGNAHLAWVQENPSGDTEVLYYSAATGIQSCSAPANTKAPVIGKLQIVLARDFQCLAGDLSQACPPATLLVDADTRALYEFNGTLEDSANASPLSAPGGATFRPTLYNKGVWLHGARADAGAATGGLDWSQNAGQLAHPFTIEMTINLGRSSGRAKLFGSTVNGDDADGWYLQDGQFQSGAGVPLAGARIEEGLLHALAIRSVDSRTVEVFIDGTAVGTSAMGLALPTSSVIFFPGGTFEGVVEAIRVSGRTVSTEQIVQSARLLQEVIAKFMVAVPGKIGTLDPKLAQVPYVLWQGEGPRVTGQVETATQLFMCAPGVSSWELSSTGGYGLPGAIHGEPTLMVDVIGRPHVAWGSVDVVTPVSNIEGTLLNAGRADVAFAAWGLYPKRLLLSEAGVVRESFAVTGAALGSFGPVVGLRMSEAAQPLRPLAWNPVVDRVTDMAEVVTKSAALTRVPGNVIAGPFVGHFPMVGSKGLDLGVGFVWVADRSADGEGSDVIALAESLKGNFAPVVAGDNVGVLSTPGAGDVDLTLSSLTPDVQGRLAPAWVERDQGGIDHVFLGGHHLKSGLLSTSETVISKIDSTLVGDGNGDILVLASTWAAKVDDVERVQVGIAAGNVAAVNTVGLTRLDLQGATVVATGAIDHAPRISVSSGGFRQGLGLAVAWSQALVPGGQPRMAISNDSLKNFAARQAAPPFISLHATESVEDIVIGLPGPTCVDSDVCIFNRPGATVAWVERRGTQRELHSLPAVFAKSTFIDSSEREAIESAVQRHVVTTAVSNLVVRPSLFGLATNLAWNQPTAPVLQSESTMLVDSVTDPGAWTSPPIKPAKGSVFAWDEVAVDLARTRDASPACSRVLCVNGTECVSSPTGGVVCKEIALPTLDVLDGETNVVISGFDGLLLDSSRAASATRAAAVAVKAEPGKIGVGVVTKGFGRALVPIASISAIDHPTLKIRVNLPLRSEVSAVAVSFRGDQRDETGFQVVYSAEGATNTTTVSNTGTIATTTPEIDDDNNEDTTELTVLQGDCGTTLTTSSGAALPGDIVTTTVQVCNTGPHVSANNVVVIEAPLETGYISDSAQCASDNYPLLTCQVGAIDPYGCHTINVVAEIDPGIVTGVPVTWTATSTSTTFDPVPGNNSSTTVVWVDSLTNVYATLAGPIQGTPGAIHDVTVSYGNNGNVNAAGVRLLTTPDLSQVEFVSATQVAGTTPLSCRFSAGVVLCDSGTGAVDVPVGETGAVVIRWKVKSTIASDALIATSTSIKTTGRQTNVWDDDAVIRTPLGDRGRGDIVGRCFFDDNANGIFDVATETPLSGPSVFFAGVDDAGTIYGPSPISAPEAYGALMGGMLQRLIGAGVIPGSQTGGLAVTIGQIANLPNYTTTPPAVCGPGGAWAFNGLIAGLYDVLQEQPAGLVSTGSNAGQFGFVVDDSPVPSPGHGIGSVEAGGLAFASGDVIRRIAVVADQVSINNDFGDRGGTLAGVVYLDTNRDGVRVSTESGVAAATVTVFLDRDRNGAVGSGDAAVAIVGADSSGAWSAGRLIVDDGSGAAHYIVVANAGPTLSPTTPSSQQLTATLARDTLRRDGLDFGYFISDFGDQDGDGLADPEDGDSDGDGIPDAVEGYGGDPSGDGNGNGVPDWTDPASTGFVDTNGDFVNDTWDTDLDGMPDIKDLDSDNDGIPDTWEAWGQPFDTDGDGLLDDATDDDGDGLWGPTDADDNDADVVTVTALTDTDGDGDFDWVDLDADGDGLSDISEGGGDDPDYDGVVGTTDGGPGDPFTDGNGNGWGAPADAGEPGGSLWPIPDSDDDGTPDWQDGDSDGDGVTDLVEPWDVSGDGQPDTTPSGDDGDGDGWDDAFDPTPCCGQSEPPFVDTDGDGVPNWLDTDDNGDGIPTSEQVGPDAGGDGSADPIDDNGNGIPDYLEAGDADEDDDGLPDRVECAGAPGYGADPDNDSDGDGSPDWQDSDTAGFVDGDGDGCDDAVDPDGDGIPNHLDSDSDGDGIPDLWEAGGIGLDVDHDGDVDGGDTDGDGVNDACDGGPDNAANTTTALAVPDTDGDALWDGLDTDADGDGHVDSDEGWDTNGDSTPDLVPTGTDGNGNGWDATWDGGEGAVFDPAWMPDTDGDSHPDWQDGDDDGDGLPTANEGLGDTDSDGALDWLDGDDDNDGVDTVTELADSTGPVGTDTDSDGAVNWLDPDADADGLIDGVDGTDDFDGDGAPNYLDTDSDADGFPDISEGLNDIDGDAVADYVDPADLPNVIDLAITATTPPSFTVGTDGNYVLHVRNVGAIATISSIIVVDVLPTGQTMTGFVGEGWRCATERGQKVVCEHQGPCAGGASLPDVKLEVSVAEAALPEVTHTADVLTDLDAHRENNTSPPVVIPVFDAAFDVDADGDGTPDRFDNDRDGDGVVNESDNCPDIDNGNQSNLDGDALGDACDVSLDADFEVAGGGGLNCAQGAGDGHWMGLGLLGLLGLVGRRRRGAGAAGLVAGLGLLALPAAAATGAVGSSDTVRASRASNLLQNGSFEIGHPGGAQVFWVTGSLAGPVATPLGWTSSGGLESYGTWVTGGSTVANSDVLPDGTSGLFMGNWFLRRVEGMPTFLGNGRVLPASSSRVEFRDGYTPVRITQTVRNLNVNHVYLLDFWVSGEDSGVDAPIGLERESFTHDGVVAVEISGEERQLFAVPHGPGALGASQRYTVEFRPTSSTLSISLVNGGHFASQDGNPFIATKGWTLGTTTEPVVDDVILNDLGPTRCDGALPFIKPCDDGNTRNGDGCSVACAVENGWTCTGLLGSTCVEDVDGDGDGDDVDDDSDDDGISDVDECAGAGVAIDASQDGNDNDIPDWRDDTVAGYSDTNGNGCWDDLDVDGDGWPSFLDPDSDNDGIPDSVENGCADADGDGKVDDGSLTPNSDTDGDGTPDWGDLDSDDDGLPDVVEAGGDDVDGNGACDGGDADDDGWPDVTDPLVSIGGGIVGTPWAQPDADTDGLPDWQDPDADGDGVDDETEGWDGDGDGAPDVTPTGVDVLPTKGNGWDDGWEIAWESGGPGGLVWIVTDTDGDHTPNWTDPDDDGDTVLTTTEGANDTDGDDIPDYLDADDDGDGVPTGVEVVVAVGLGVPPDIDGSGGPNWLDPDADGDGVPDGGENLGDDNGDGIPDWTQSTVTSPDVDGDGVPNASECASLLGACPDTDNDGAPDWSDPDDDGDGLSTGSECPVFSAGCPDTDSNGTDDWQDVDDDGDGLPTDVEVLVSGQGPWGTDPDGDGFVNWADPDSDDDTIADGDEPNDANGDGVPDWVSSDDFDGDGIPDGDDPDDDNDGIVDSNEPGESDGDGFPDRIDIDSDDDGIIDSVEGEVDTDGDTVPDCRDTDTDGDSIPDVIEGHAGVGPGGQDDNGNGLNDAWDPAVGGTAAPLPNHDDDAIPDWRDVDDENDGVPTAGEDVDGDGDPTNDDTDTDGIGNWLDADDDADGVPTSVEVSSWNGPDDVDGDGRDNWVDADADADGIPDGVEGVDDLDGDAVPNFVDPDSDGDGIPDRAEGLADFDGDGTPNWLDGVNNSGIDVEIAVQTPEVFFVGRSDVYGIDVRNIGRNRTISPVTVVDTLPQGQTLAGSDGDGWLCGTEGQKVTCVQESILESGAALPTLTLTVATDALAIPELTHAAVADTDLDDDTTNNASPGVVIPVLFPAELDRDGDTVPDAQDNCVDVPNTDQRDRNSNGVGDACDIFEVAGGGGVNCASGGTPGPLALLGMAMAIPLFGFRRRRHPGRVLMLAAAVLAVTAVTWGTSARAQLQETGSFPSEHFAPAMDRDGINDVEWGATGEHLTYDVSLWGGYSLNPLVLYQRVDGVLQNAGSLVEHQVNTHLTGAISLFDWLELGADVPVTLFQSRNDDAISPALQTRPLAPTGLGDLRLMPKLRILKSDERSPIDLAFIPGLTLPTSIPTGSYFGDATPTFAPQVAVSRAMGGLRLAGNVGYRLRGESEFVNLIVGQELFYRAGVAYRLHDGWNVPLQLAASLRGSTYVLDPFSQINTNPLEVLAGATVDVGDDWQLFADVGTGIVAGFGVPQFRALAGVRLSPRQLDRDHDGITDRVDACPDVAEDKDSFEDVDGCPDPDNDRDGIVDTADQCPLDPEDVDSFEDQNGCPDPDNDRDGILDVKDDCPLQPEDFDSFEDNNGCPDPDNDQDGIVDVDDRCPVVPGVVAHQGCPPPDRDGDGVADSEDACIDVPGLAVFQGCGDRDRDGIADNVDKCPDEPETINGFQDEDGCPDKGKSKVLLTKNKIEILEKVFFDFDKATIQKRSFALLNQVVLVLKANPQIDKLRVEGHTDADGDDKYNFKLSDARAASVRTYLADHGVEAIRLSSAGYGETRPIADNKTAAGREKNRRVEFVILDETDVAGDANEVRGTKGVSEEPVRPFDTPTSAPSPAPKKPAPKKPAPEKPAPKKPAPKKPAAGGAP